MAPKKGVINNPHGRPKGVPNRNTADLRLWVDMVVKKNCKQFESDLMKLEPRDRLIILERLMQYTIPKQQSISAEAKIQAEYASLENLLSNAPEEAIREITARIMTLNQTSKKI
jgi:hypothetical protein